jgi:hypothetical protein
LSLNSTPPRGHQKQGAFEIHAPQCRNEVNIEEDGVAVEVCVPLFIVSSFSFPSTTHPSNAGSGNQKANKSKVNTAEDEAALEADTKAVAVDTPAIASGQRKKTSSTWESTWTRRSA